MIDILINFFYNLTFFVTPLIMIPITSELFEFNKMIFIYLTSSIIALLWIIKMIVNKKIILKKTPLDIPILLFVISQVLSTVFSIDIHTSIFGYYGRFNGGLLSTVSYLVLFYGFVSNSLDWKKILKTSLLSSVIVMLWAIPGKFNHDLTCPTFLSFIMFYTGNFSQKELGDIWTNKFNNSCWSSENNVFNPALRVFSTLGQPNWMGAYLAVMFFIGVYFFIKEKNNRKQQIILFIYLLLNLLEIFFTKSRSALIAVFAGIFIFAFFYFEKINYLIKKYWFILVGVLMIVGVVFYFSSHQKSSSSVTDSLDIRTIVWQGAIKLGLKYPLLGTGVETFAYSYYFTRPIAHNLTSEWDYLYNRAHNEYLNFLATTGFIGMLTYLFLIFSFLFLIISQFSKSKLLDNKKILILCLGLSYLTILITNFFGFSTTTISLFFYLIPAIVIVQLDKEENKKIVEEKNKIIFWQWFLIAVFILFEGYLVYSLGVYFVADTKYSAGLNYIKPAVNNYPKAAMYFNEAVNLRPEPVYQDKFSSTLAYVAALAYMEKNTQMTNQYLSYSDYLNIATIKSSPKNVLYWKTRAKNRYYYYQITQDTNELIEGINALITAANLSPTDPKIPYSLAVYYSLYYDTQKDTVKKQELKDEAFKQINLALKLKPDFEDAKNLLNELNKKFANQ